ncbi:VOC family protein [Nocardioides sp.]|uniref:VOC family protein n=1 Tax=Nocardioides sp. TaxID=35761 RepID=UPI002634F6F8|nr:VOC family protein [Nocardioides sp.]
MPRPRAVLDQLNIVVKDMARAVDFYTRLGLEVPSTLPVWQGHHRTVEGAGLDVDLDSAAFARHWNQGWPAGAAGVVLGFRVASREEVDALYAELTAAGHAGPQPPYDAFWGARYAVVEDPSGNAVGLMSPVDPDRRRPPPEPPE